MIITPQQILSGTAIGLAASLLMDGWNLFLNRAFRVPSLNYCLLGRWVLHMPEGTFRHPGIAAAAPRRFECPVGWMAHYTIGIVLALLFLAIAPDDWRARPTLLPAILYGIGTVVFPLFVLQPCLGFGIASARTPSPARARVKSIVTHVVFGFGLYVSAMAWSLLGFAG